ncbi:pyridoxal-phosphate dependent enzyme [Leucobacter musarum]|uniref:pyridoxal-phosphate dependent enzyme n=1 Tax=Leucobacter musarum TaxID=1930747 RepID=UPI0006A7E257|nr:pyridoxal-phosphate dependent enzyme [Leucobacter musarum]
MTESLSRHPFVLVPDHRAVDTLLEPWFAAATDPALPHLRRHREPLVFGPTPVHRLDRLREALGGGPRLWIKRDDQTGLALGGNKARKLEYLVAEARAAGADTLVTVGAVQSNHARQTAAAAARAGLDALLVLRVPAGISVGRRRSGNVLLNELLGAAVEYVDETPEDPHPERAAAAAALERLRAAGRTPFFIPSGGSTSTGALGYVESFAEIAALAGRGLTFHEIVVASGSGGTQAGLLAGRELFPEAGRPRVHGVAVSPGAPELAAGVEAHRDEVLARFGAGAGAAVAGSTAASVEVPSTDPAILSPDQVGDAYGALTPAAIEAIELFARTEGVLLDPVYTAKAAAALVAGVRAGAHPGDADVLFLHTGGAPGLFAYAEDLPRASLAPVDTGAGA